MNTPLDYVVRQACELFGHNSRQFTTATFQHAMATITQTQPMIGGHAAEIVLMSVPGVTREGLCLWRWNGLGE